MCMYCCLTLPVTAVNEQKHTFLKDGKFTGLGIDNFAAEVPGPERPL